MSSHGGIDRNEVVRALGSGGPRYSITDFRVDALFFMRAMVLCLFVLLIPAVAFCDLTLTGNVIKVYDGDTIRVCDEHGYKYKVRLSAIDAPEKDQPFGAEASEKLRELVMGKNVVIKGAGIGVWGRLIGVVYIGDTNANQKMIESGLAWHYKEYDQSETLTKLEATARKKKLGLWSDEKALAPWVFRKNQKEAEKEDQTSDASF